MGEPLLVACTLGAVRAGLAGRSRSALVIGALGALVRPEVWPLLVAYGVWCARRDRRIAPLVARRRARSCPILWIAPGLLDAGSAGAARAQTGTSNPAEALGWALVLPLAVAWPLALVALRDRAARVLAAGALAWIAIVIGHDAYGLRGPAALHGARCGDRLRARRRRPRDARRAPARDPPGARRAGARPHADRAARPDQRGAARVAQRGADHGLARQAARGRRRDRPRPAAALRPSGDERCARAHRPCLGRSARRSPRSSASANGRASRARSSSGCRPRPICAATCARTATEVASRGEWRVYSLACPVTASASAATQRRRRGRDPVGQARTLRSGGLVPSTTGSLPVRIGRSL